MQTPKPSRNNSSEAPQKISPRAVRQLRTTALEFGPASSSILASRTAKDRSPKANERRSPRSPASELQKKRPNRVSELELQISQLRNDLKRVKDQLSSSESWKRTAQQDAEDSKQQLLAMSSKLQESQKQLLELSASEEAAWKQNSFDSTALDSAVDEFQQSKVLLEMVDESEFAQIKHAESADAELQSLKEDLEVTLSHVDDLKKQLRDCKESEAQARALMGETLLRLETTKKTAEILRSDGIKAKENYHAIALDLDQSRAYVNLLEGLLSKLKVENKFKAEEFVSVNAELELLMAALETSEMRYHEEQIQSTIQIGSANEMVERIKSASSLREAELEAEINKAKADIEELKANLMDKETELQGILEENEGLNTKLEKSLVSQRECKLEKEVNKSKEYVEDLKENLMDKETELQNISEENEILKLKIKRREMNNGEANEEIVREVELARAAEEEALMKLGFMTEEADKSKRKAARAAEQLEAAEAVMSDMQAELRKLKVQCDQWRKAAEAAVTMLSPGNNKGGKFMERVESVNNCYNPHVMRKIGLPYSEEGDDDLLKKKNGSVLKKIGVLWKKPHQK